MPGPKRGAIQRARTFVKMLTGWLCRVAPGLWALQRRSAWGEGEHQVDRAPEPTCHVGWRTESGRARSPLAPTTRADRAQTVAPHRLRLPEQRRGQGEEEAPGGGVGTWDGAGGRGEMVRARNREGASADSHAAAPPLPGPGEARVCCEPPVRSGRVLTGPGRRLAVVQCRQHMLLVQRHIRKLATKNTCLKTTNMMFRTRLDAWAADWTVKTVCLVRSVAPAPRAVRRLCSCP